MKSLFLLGLVGLFSLGSVLDAEAGCRRRCGGGRSRGCGGGGGGCYSQPQYAQPSYGGGCQVYGGATGGYNTGGYVDPNMAHGAGVQGGATVDANAVPGQPEPAR